MRPLLPLWCHISVSKRRIAGSPYLLIAGTKHLAAQSVNEPHACHPQPFSNNCNHFSTCCVCISRAFLRKMIWSSGYSGGWWHSRSSGYESPWPFTLSHTHIHTVKHTYTTVFVNVFLKNGQFFWLSYRRLRFLFHSGEVSVFGSGRHSWPKYTSVFTRTIGYV